MIKKLFLTLAWTAMVLVLNGNTDCAHTQYTIEMKASADKVERKLTCKRTADEGATCFSDDSKRIKKVYGSQGTSAQDGALTISSTFSGKLPRDVGGSGQFQSMTCPLGRTSAYMERFRGTDKLGQNMQASLAGVDQVCDLLIGWADWTMQEQEGYSKLRTFLDERLRPDLKNLLAHLSTLIVMDDYHKGMEEEIGLRVMQYLLEREYLGAQDVPTILAAFLRDESRAEGERHGIMNLVRRKLAQEMGIAAEKPIPAVLNFLKTPQTAHESMTAYVRSTKVYRTAALADPKLTVDTFVQNKLEQIMQLRLFETPDKVAVSLSCAKKPYRSNGEWDEAKSSLTWKMAAIRSQPRLATFSYAFWSEPDLEAQQKIFGKMVLRGEDLANYIIWFNGLDKAESERWSTLLDKVSAAKTTVAKRTLLSKFKFDSKVEEDQDTLATFATSLILDKLGQAEGGTKKGTKKVEAQTGK